MYLLVYLIADRNEVQRIFPIGAGAAGAGDDVMYTGSGMAKLVVGAAPLKEIPAGLARHLGINFILTTVRWQSCFLSTAAGAGQSRATITTISYYNLPFSLRCRGSLSGELADVKASFPPLKIGTCVPPQFMYNDGTYIAR